MNKGEMITVISERSGVAKSDVERVMRGFEDVCQQIVAKGEEKLVLPGFMAVEQKSQAARVGRNPRTGEPQQIKARKSAKFTAGATIKAIANSEKPAPT